jgi:hypothetical protein
MSLHFFLSSFFAPSSSVLLAFFFSSFQIFSSSSSVSGSYDRICFSILSQNTIFLLRSKEDPDAKDFPTGTLSLTHERIIPGHSVYNLVQIIVFITTILSSVFVWSFQIGFRFSFTGRTA